MENEVFKKLKMLVEALTHSGCDTLDEDILKEIKGICKSSKDNVLHVYSLLLAELKKNNSQIRLAAFKVCKELFKRSSLFRENVLRDLQLIFDLTTEINSSKKLPPPKSSAKSLECLIMSTLKEWVEEFGEIYKKLKVAYKYFENTKQVNFETLEVGSAAERIVENEQQRHWRIIGEERIKRVLDEYNANLPEIESTITSLSNCICLLLPPVEEFFIPEQSLQKINVTNNISNSENKSGINNGVNTIAEDENEDNENYLWNNKSNLRECGVSYNYNLSLQLNLEDTFKIDKTKENSMVIESAKDCIKLINNRFFPMIKKWIKVYSIFGDRNSSSIKKIIDLREKLEKILKKYNSLIIQEETYIDNNESDSDDDYEFEEVKKEGYEHTVDFSEELLLDCIKNIPDAGNSIDAVPSTSKDSCKEFTVNTQTSSNSVSQSKSENLLKSVSPILDRKKKLPSVSSISFHDIDSDNFNESKAIPWTVINEKFWGSAGVNELQKNSNSEGVLASGTEVTATLTILNKRKKKRKSENKNMTHKKMKTSAAALRILESKNLPGLVDVVKRQNNTYMRLSKKLFKRSARKK